MKLRAIKLLDSYGSSDMEFFYGRLNETQDLFEKVKKSRLTLLYGLSGTGKTSLVQCGLAGKFTEDTWLPLIIRRGENIINSIRSAIDKKANIKTQSYKSLVDALTNLYLDHFIPLTLIFDQFEELFISGEKQEIDDFISILSEIIKINIDCRVILIVREEYLAFFDIFEQKIPSVFDNRMRLERMRRQMVEQVISSIIEASDENRDIVSRMADNISDKKGNIELTHLQIYLDKLNRLNITEFNVDSIKSVGRLENILGDFLEEQTRLIIDQIGNKELVWKILKKLITDDGTKKPVSTNDIRTFFPETQWTLLSTCLELLEKSRIIKKESGLYELTHDNLAAKIAENLTNEEKALVEVTRIIHNATIAYKSTGALMAKKQLSFIRNYEDRMPLTPEEKKVIRLSQRQHNLNRNAMAFSMLLFFLVLGIFSIRQLNTNKSLTKSKIELDSINNSLKNQICSRLQTEAEKFIYEYKYDLAIKKFEEALVEKLCDSTYLKARIGLAETLKSDYSICVIWKFRVDSLFRKTDYDGAISLCDSILKRFPEDEVTFEKRSRIIEKSVDETLSKVQTFVDENSGPGNSEKACDMLIKAHKLQSRQDSAVLRLISYFNCKIDTI
jgi:hypothetical protein